MLKLNIALPGDKNAQQFFLEVVIGVTDAWNNLHPDIKSKITMCSVGQLDNQEEENPTMAEIKISLSFSIWVCGAHTTIERNSSITITYDGGPVVLRVISEFNKRIRELLGLAEYNLRCESASLLSLLT